MSPRLSCVNVPSATWLHTCSISFPFISHSLRPSLAPVIQSDATEQQQLLLDAPETRAAGTHCLCSWLPASKPKYTFDFSEEEADEEENGEDDVATSPVRSLKDDFTSSETKNRYSDHDDNDEDDDNDVVVYSPMKQKPT